MTVNLSAEDRETLQAANRIKRSLKRERRRNLLAQRLHKKKHRGRERDTGYLAYLRRQPCEVRHMGGCDGPIHAAHIRYSDAKHGVNPGMGRKNHDRHANPLCERHHLHDQHQRSERTFWAEAGKDPYEVAAGHYEAYRRAA